MAVRIAIGSVGFGFSSLSYFYGVSACRAFLGPQAFNSIISSPLEPPHPKHFITMPLVAPALVLSRTNLIDALFPLLPLALLNFPPTALYNSGYIKGLRLLRIPSPATTCLLLPFIRHFYLKGRSWIYRKALARQSKKNTLSGAASGMTTPLPETPAPNTPAVHFEAQIVHHHQGDAQHQRQQNRPEAPQQAQEPNPDDLEPGAQVTLSLHRLAGMVVGALVLPFVSAGAGEMLLQVSKSSGILRAVLGLQNEVVWKSAIGSLLPFGGVPQASMDPAWWRNTIGGVLVVMSNDLLKVRPLIRRERRVLTAC